MRIAVAGGTGCAGRLVVRNATRLGHLPVVIARSAGVDLTTGAGLAAALDGADAVIDVTNITTTSRARAVAFFEAATSTLVCAAARAGVRHLVALSIVGCDRTPVGYYAGKLRQEELVLAGRLPSTVLRATQFHEFAAQLIGRGIGPFVPAPRILSQPVAADEVATALVELATGPAVGLAPELAGPEERQLVPMVRQVVKARGLRRIVVPIPVPGNAGSGAQLPTGRGPRGRQSFDEWLRTGLARHGAPQIH